MTPEDIKRIKARHKPHHRTIGQDICVYDLDIWPCDAAQLAGLYAEVLNFTTIWREPIVYNVDDYGCTMQCVEAEAAAGLWRAIGDEGTATALLLQHARHDTEEDQHEVNAAGEVIRRALDEHEEPPVDGDSGPDPVLPSGADV